MSTIKARGTALLCPREFCSVSGTWYVHPLFLSYANGRAEGMAWHSMPQALLLEECRRFPCGGVDPAVCLCWAIFAAGPHFKPRTHVVWGLILSLSLQLGGVEAECPQVYFLGGVVHGRIPFHSHLPCPTNRAICGNHVLQTVTWTWT